LLNGIIFSQMLIPSCPGKNSSIHLTHAIIANNFSTAFLRSLRYMSVPPEEDDANSALTSALAIAACAPSDKSYSKSYSKGIVVMRSCPKMLKTVSRQLSISGWQQIRLYFTAKHDICLPINKIWNDAERGCLMKAAALCVIPDIRSISTLHIPLPHWSP
jgi:hypothetical protein